MFHNCKNVYLKTLPTMVTFSGTAGLLTGFCSYGNNSIINGDKDNRKNKIPSAKNVKSKSNKPPPLRKKVIGKFIRFYNFLDKSRL